MTINTDYIMNFVQYPNDDFCTVYISGHVIIFTVESYDDLKKTMPLSLHKISRGFIQLTETQHKALTQVNADEIMFVYPSNGSDKCEVVMTDGRFGVYNSYEYVDKMLREPLSYSYPIGDGGWCTANNWESNISTLNGGMVADDLHG